MDLGAYFVSLQYVLMGSVFISLTLIFLYIYYGKEEEEENEQNIFIANFFHFFRFIIKQKTALRVARIIAIKISQIEFGPEPKTIGNDPMKITTLPFVELQDNKETTAKIAMPTKTKLIPKINRPKIRLFVMSSFSFSSGFLTIYIYLSNQ